MKKILSIAFAALITTAALPLSASADFTVEESSYNGYVAGKLKDTTRLDSKYSPLFYSLGYDENTNFHLKSNSEIIAETSLDNEYFSDILCSIYGNEPESIEQFKEIVQERFGDTVELEYYEPAASFMVRTSPNMVREIGAFFKETGKVSNFVRIADLVALSKIYLPFTASYSTSQDKKIAQSIIDFAEQNETSFSPKLMNFECGGYFEVETLEESSYIFLMPKGEDTAQARLDAALEVYNGLGYSPDGISSELSDLHTCYTVDLMNNINGDANNDGKINISDATIILQSLGNPDKYKLTPQGKFNADIYNFGDGVTAKDALMIQEIASQR